MSSCLSGGGRTYGFDLDIVKPSSSSSGRLSHTSSPSSTLSDSSNSALAISIKKARTPRKRPNQTYNEAAALLSTIYPNIFSAKGLNKLSRNTKPFSSLPESSDLLLPPFPVLSDAAFLIHQPQPEKPAAFQLELKHKVPFDKECTSPASSISWEPNSPDTFNDDFDAESILDEEVEEGIDSIMGNLSMNTPPEVDKNEELSNHNSSINPLLRRLIGHRTSSGRFDFGLGLHFGRNLQRALRNRDDGDWWRSPAVPVQNLVSHSKPPAATPASGKKKKKPNKQESDMKNTASTTSSPLPEKLKAGLGLKLNHEEVLKAWSDRGSMFSESDSPDSPNLSVDDALARLADIDLFPDAGGVREASVMRYKEKRRSRLFSKKIRYQVRKVNADRRPRMKGRFVRSPSLLQQAIEDESQ
ncbi:protein CHLOROPLAST IMPORT APPARATUS 2-like isoform X2 [Canna indica]|uniref:Protein CHLOROPLAST IMPORT APPARATUS 2-like isoform X2 n=1 Tax=Canna indica TaxID=4628 RepID=A0AAQ3Q4J8_9LILI|nr:protein CHLOROPLAST IMPORT APPARATUS 2-like isoform X2 [Canna indica]